MTEAVCSYEKMPSLQVGVSFFLLVCGLQGIISDSSKARARFCGPMAVSSPASGRMASSMAWESSVQPMAINEQASGEKVCACAGLTRRPTLQTWLIERGWLRSYAHTHASIHTYA